MVINVVNTRKENVYLRETINKIIAYTSMQYIVTFNTFIFMHITNHAPRRMQTIM